MLNSCSSCNDLIFTSLLNLVTESGVHSTLHRNYHHQAIRWATNESDWIRALSNVSVDEKVHYFTKTLLNIIHNFIPYERYFCDDRDPPWINYEFKTLINVKNSACKSYYRFNRYVFLFGKFKVLQNQLNMPT